MFLGVEDRPFAAKCVVSGGDTLIAMVPSHGKRIAVLAVARRPGGGVYFVESMFGTRVRAGTWRLSHDIGGEAYEANGGMPSGRNYQAILERLWDTLPYRR